MLDLADRVHLRSFDCGFVFPYLLQPGYVHLVDIISLPALFACFSHFWLPTFAHHALRQFPTIDALFRLHLFVC